MWMEAYQSAPGIVCLRLEPAATAPLTQRIPSPEESVMSQPAQHHAINYIELTTTDMAKSRAFYEKVFGWNFQDWGPDYMSFDKVTAGLDGGFRKGEPNQAPADSAPLIILYSQDLKATQDAILAAGGSLVVPTFEFPGGRRFHFSDGQGNVLAVWSE
jgi:predicted enzyme related to lactoylglutathione lyase